MRKCSGFSFGPLPKVALLGILLTILAPAGIAAAGLGNPGANSTVSGDSPVAEDSPVGEDSSPEIATAYITVANRLNNNNLGTSTPVDAVTTFENGDIFFPLEDRTKTEIEAGKQSAIFSSLDGYDTTFKRCFDTATGEDVGQSEFYGLIEAEPGQHLRCIFAHNDVATKIRIANRVFNNGVGTATSDDVSVQLDGYEIASKQWISITPGSHDLTFDHLDGYDVKKFECMTRNGDSIAIDGNTVNVPEGEFVLCVIAQNDTPTRLRVATVVFDHSNNRIYPSDLGILVDGQEADDRTTISVAPGAHIVEVELDGFEITKNRCNAANDRNVSLDDQTVTLDEGAMARCRIVLRPSS